MTRRVKISWWFFLWGLGSELQLVASLSITELCVFIAAPVLVFQEWYYLRRNGMLPMFWLSIAVVIGCVVSCFVNHTETEYVLRGLATVCLTPCAIVVGHRLLRKDMNGFKWMLVGAAISVVICTFFFRQANEVVRADRIGGDAVEAIMSGPIYWIKRLRPFLYLPAQGWYLQCPLVYSVAAPLFLAGFAMLTTTSGRSAALGAIASAGLVILGGRTRAGIKRICRYFWVWVCLSVFAVVAVKAGYSFLATHDVLGDAARAKYEHQTKGGDSVMRLLLSGRMESFAGLLAAVDNPIIGFGPWPEDRGEYMVEFLSRYGNYEDYNYAMSYVSRCDMFGVRRGIPCHSCITQYWVWFGMFGLLFWLYILFVIFRFLKQDCWVVPQWHMWITAAIPSTLWAIFFGAMLYRVGMPLFFVACLMARAVRKGTQELPCEMIEEIIRRERR